MRFIEIKNNLKKYIKLYSAIYKDKRTPLISRIFLWLALGYFFMPFDIIPDFIPVLGQLDDLLIVPGLIFIALKFIPREIYRGNYRKVLGKS